ncbi:MAG TPA: MarR family transcriptional regulator [Microlunatus sp.]|nr:MarR family transcriptional regulator [Microlunatus sp.]
MAKRSERTGRSEIDEVRSEVATYVAAGADESVQQVITAVHRLSRRLTQWYDVQLADHGLSAGEWAVLSALGRLNADAALTPTQLAAEGNVAPSSMTHRLDRMVERGLVTRTADPANRTRVLVRLADAGWQRFATAIREANVVESGLLAGLEPEQVRALTTMLEQMIRNLEAAQL